MNLLVKNVWKVFSFSSDFSGKIEELVVTFLRSIISLGIIGNKIYDGRTNSFRVTRGNLVKSLPSSLTKLILSVVVLDATV